MRVHGEQREMQSPSYQTVLQCSSELQKPLGIFMSLLGLITVKIICFYGLGNILYFFLIINKTEILVLSKKNKKLKNGGYFFGLFQLLHLLAVSFPFFLVLPALRHLRFVWFLPLGLHHVSWMLLLVPHRAAPLLSRAGSSRPSKAPCV